MTIFVFLGSLIGCMAIGMPIAYALILCGVALMLHLDIFDAQIIATNIINGADSFPLMAVPFFMLAGEIMNIFYNIIYNKKPCVVATADIFVIGLIIYTP